MRNFMTHWKCYIHNPSHNNATERRFVWHGDGMVQEKLRRVETAMQGRLTQHYVPIPWNFQTLFLLEFGSAVSPKGPRSRHGPQDSEELVKSKEVEPSGRSLGHWGLRPFPPLFCFPACDSTCALPGTPATTCCLTTGPKQPGKTNCGREPPGTTRANKSLLSWVAQAFV